MNIDKVNATLGKAIVHIQEGETADLRSAFLEQDGDESESFVEECVDGLVDCVAEASGVDDEVATKAVIESIEHLSEKTPATVKSAEELAAWADKVGLADEIARRLS